MLGLHPSQHVLQARPVLLSKLGGADIVLLASKLHSLVRLSLPATGHKASLALRCVTSAWRLGLETVLKLQHSMCCFKPTHSAGGVEQAVGLLEALQVRCQALRLPGRRVSAAA